MSLDKNVVAMRGSGTWVVVGTARTNANGRVRSFAGNADFVPGIYRLQFDMTARSTKTSTSVLAERAASDPGSRDLLSVPELLLLDGGLPIVPEGEVISGIGVAGSGGSASDEACASAALATLRS